MTRIVTPIVADFQREREGVPSSRRVTRLWVTLRWTAALAATLVLDACSRPYSPDESRVHRTLWTSVGLGSLALVCLNVVVVSLTSGVVATAAEAGRIAGATRLVLYLVPSGLVIGPPLGLLFGATGCERSSGRRIRPMLTVAVSTAVFMVLMLAFVVPASNQAFRTDAWRTLSSPEEAPAPPKGEREMSFAELRAEAFLQRFNKAPLLGRPYQTEIHRRLALATAALPLTWLAASLAGTMLTRRLWRRLTLVATIATAYVGLLSWGRHLAVFGSLDAPVLVWMANVVFAAVAAALHFARHSPRLDVVSP